MCERRLTSKRLVTVLGLAAGLSLCLAKGVATAPQDDDVPAKAGAVKLPPSLPATNEWLTLGYEQERTLWSRAEKTLGKDNVGQLTLKWKTQIPTAPRGEVLSTFTSPPVATVSTRQGPSARVYVAGSGNTVYAVDAATGAIVWQKEFPNPHAPPIKPDYRSPSTLNATPVIDKETGTIYVSTNDGKLRGLGLVNGEERMQPADFTDEFARNWSLNLIDGVIYSPTARGCLGIMSHFTAFDLKTRRRQEFFTGTGIPAGAWGRGGLTRTAKYILAQTADGPYDPALGQFLATR